MEKSKDELLAGISELSGLDPFPDEIFYQIFENRGQRGTDPVRGSAAERSGKAEAQAGV